MTTRTTQRAAREKAKTPTRRTTARKDLPTSQELEDLIVEASQIAAEDIPGDDDYDIQDDVYEPEPERPAQNAKRIDKTKPPIAVVDSYGHILPFTANNVDRFYLMQANVTYIWDKETLRKVMAHNEKQIRTRAFQRTLHGDVLPVVQERPALNSREVRAAVFKPNMLQM